MRTYDVCALGRPPNSMVFETILPHICPSRRTLPWHSCDFLLCGWGGWIPALVIFSRVTDEGTHAIQFIVAFIVLRTVCVCHRSGQPHQRLIRACSFV